MAHLKVPVDSRLMLKLEEVQSLYKETDIDPGDTPESVLNTFIMALGRKYSSLQVRGSYRFYYGRCYGESRTFLGNKKLNV